MLSITIRQYGHFQVFTTFVQRFFIGAALLGCVSCLQAVAENPVADEIVAYVGEQPITYGEVDFQLGRRAPVDPNVKLPQLSTAILQSTVHLIAQQRQALQTLRVQKQGVKREEVERWIAENVQPKTPETVPIADFIRDQATAAGISDSAFREHIAFRMAWQQYLRQHLTEKNVAKHFENHKSRFDGTQFRVASLAIAVPAGDSKLRESATSYLIEVQGRLKNASTTWQDLKRSLDDSTIELPTSIAPERVVLTAERWIRGTADEHPAVVTELTKMMAGEFSSPIDTPTAVQFDQLLETKPGERELIAARDEVRADMLLFLLEHLASQSRKQLPLHAEK